jgi:hypothetical protein
MPRGEAAGARGPVGCEKLEMIGQAHAAGYCVTRSSDQPAGLRNPLRKSVQKPIDADRSADVLAGRIRRDLSDPSGHSISMFVAMA